MKDVIVLVDNREYVLDTFDTMQVEAWGGRGTAIRISAPDRVSETKDGGVRIEVGGEDTKLMSGEIVDVVDR